jgi:hypothetical protein
MQTKKLTLGKKILFSSLAFVISLVIVVIALEIFFTLVPVRGINKHGFYYDPLIGGRSYPEFEIRYITSRNEIILRQANKYGWLDRVHSLKKPPNTYRIGIFGDSFTEARQVGFDSTFFRIFEKRVNETLQNKVEVLSFGLSGLSTYSSFLNYKANAKKYDLDLAIYHFCENDLGDQLADIQRAQGIDTIPLLDVHHDSVVVDTSFREKYAYKTKWPHRTFQWLKSHSYIISLLTARYKLLQRMAARNDMNANISEQTSGNGSYIPDQNDLPSKWPPILKLKAERIGEWVLRQWHEATSRDSIDFAVMYIPQPVEFHKPDTLQNTWKCWLRRTCNRLRIVLIDPSPLLLAKQKKGIAVFGDHYTETGHRTVAETLYNWFENRETLSGTN